MRYYVSKKAQSGGEHEVHELSCSHGPDADNREYLGDFSSCAPAVRAARKVYSNVDGCWWCSRECHTR